MNVFTVNETKINSAPPGLSDTEAAQRLATEGFNELPSARRRSGAAIALSVLREPMFILLASAGTIYLLLGNMEEALMLLGFVFVIMAITFLQERRTEHALDALRGLSSPRALVMRNGARKRIAGREVVRDDILILTEGDRVPADAIVISCTTLTVDEALITGESAPVRKTASVSVLPARQRPGGEDTPFVYSGTMIVQGTAFARVYATGINTEIGKIGKTLRAFRHEKTALQQETGKTVRNLAAAGLVLCAAVIILYGITRNDWLSGFLAGIALAMAVLPEEFPVVLTIFLAVGAWRISRNHVLARRIGAVEALGSINVLCVDKTGTLTHNRMDVQALALDGEYRAVDPHMPVLLPERYHALAEYALLASRDNPFDPMESAIRNFAECALAGTEHIHGNWTLAHEYPLEHKLLAMSRAWQSPDGREFIVASKGAPEAIIELCHLPPCQAAAILETATSMASRGLRILGVARSWRKGALPGGQHAFPFLFVGLLGLADSLREGVADAIAECARASIRVMMLTGDYPVTATEVARKAGFKDFQQVITGENLDMMSDEELRARLPGITVVARAIPEQKLRIVTALQQSGRIVAMTGDGVNDAPALKTADIGIAMGTRGTDVARESAAIVALNDDFSSIVTALKMGRRIYDNIKKAMSYILAVHVPIAGISLLPVIFTLPMVLLPVHIVFLELIIDPACSIAFEAEEEEPDIMLRPPRPAGKPVFDARTLLLSILQGTSVLLVISAVYFIAIYTRRSEAEARTLTFTTLVFANLALILTNRSWTLTIPASARRKNKALWIILALAVSLLSAALCIPALRHLFGFSTLHTADLALTLTAATTTILWFEILKYNRGRP